MAFLWLIIGGYEPLTTPQKSKIDTNNSHFLRELPFFKPSLWVYIYVSFWECNWDDPPSTVLSRAKAGSNGQEPWCLKKVSVDWLGMDGEINTFPRKKKETNMSSVQNPGWLFDIEDYTTQVYGDYNKPI